MMSEEACPGLNVDETIRSVTTVGRYRNSVNQMISIWVRTAVVLVTLVFSAPAMAQQQWFHLVLIGAPAEFDSQTSGELYYSGIISFQDVAGSQGLADISRYENEFTRLLEEKFGFGVIVGPHNYWNWDSEASAEEFLSRSKADCEPGNPGNWVCFFTNWVPGTELHITEQQTDGKEKFVKDSNVPDWLFSPQAHDATRTWMEQNGIAQTGDAERTLALMVQTALASQDFDPGPKDGKIGSKTLAAIAAWQAMAGFLSGADLGDVLAAILHTAMQLQGLDPGPVGRMFGQDALDTVDAWKSAHGSALAKAQRAQPDYGEEDGDLLLVPGWFRVPSASSCVSIDFSKSGNTQFIVNYCNHKVEVHWCYVDRPEHYAQCDPGPPGLGFMDAIERVASKGAEFPDYYWGREHLFPKSVGDRVYGHDYSSMKELGVINYIACGYEHIKSATRYKMQWDAHTGRFRCLAYIPPDEPHAPSEAGVE